MGDGVSVFALGPVEWQPQVRSRTAWARGNVFQIDRRAHVNEPAQLAGMGNPNRTVGASKPASPIEKTDAVIDRDHCIHRFMTRIFRQK